MNQNEIEELSEALRDQGLTWNQTNSVVALVRNMQDKAQYEAIGWCHAFCCASLDDGIDPRGIEVPDILEKAQQQLEPNGLITSGAQKPDKSAA